MARFDTWCTVSDSKVGAHDLHLLEADEARMQDAIDATAAVLPGHYVSPERVAAALARLGKTRAAAMIAGKLPTTPQMRSGDLGEILATEWIVARAEFDVPIRKLRWGDHRDMAMRGDDVLGFAVEEVAGHTARLLILKVEAKSRAALQARVITEAREALDRHEGRPDPHALSFVADRLHEAGRHDLADAIDDVLHVRGIPLGTVQHMLFVFASRSPEAHLRSSLAAYAGPVAQRSVGLSMARHGDFVRAVFDLVAADADDD